jgi:hypothetical protein
MRLAKLVAASAAFTTVIGGLAATSFAAPPVKSNLVASPTAVTVDVWSGAANHQATVNVHLDENCVQATDSTKYSIAAGDTGLSFSVSPAVSGLLDCTQSANFTITGLVATTSPVTLHFSPLGKNQGVQKKLGNGVDVFVTVEDHSPTPTASCTTDCPTPGARPAAPAVSNALINMNADLANACKIGRGKNWRGDVISTVAHTMPKPESVKDNTAVFPTLEDWVAFVKNGNASLFPNFAGLYSICGYSEPSV